MASRSLRTRDSHGREFRGSGFLVAGIWRPESAQPAHGRLARLLVTNVANMPTDAEIQQAVLSALARDGRIDETDVGVEVDDGVVTLTGTVANWGKRFVAQEAAHRVDGVLDVANDIEVKVPGTGAPTDTQIAGAVRRALYEDKLLPSHRIRTTVADGSVILEGDVIFSSQREEAEKTVRRVTGVGDVTNRINVLLSKA